MFKLIINNEPNRYTNALTIERARKLLNSRLIEESCRLLLTLLKKSNVENAALTIERIIVYVGCSSHD